MGCWYQEYLDRTAERAGLRSHYNLQEILAVGNSSEVWLARHRRTGTRVAIKFVQKMGAWPYSLLSKEVDIMKSLNHPNVVKLYEVIHSPKHVYFVMELVERGELMQHIEKAGRLQEQEACRILIQIVWGLMYCHGSGVVHGDLKPENILLDKHWDVKLSDFGIGSRFEEGQKVASYWCTVNYRAPEVFRCRVYDGPKADIWSLGVILFIMVTGTQPFEALTLSCLQKKIKAGRYMVPCYIPADLKDIIHRLLSINPAHRPTLEEVLQHPWILRCAPDPLPRPMEVKAEDKQLNFRILQRMSKLGYNPLYTHRSLSKNSFNGAMATYLMLEDQAQKREDAKKWPSKKFKAKPVAPRPLPRRDSDPSIYFRSCPLWKPPVPLAQPKTLRRATMPAPPVCSPEDLHSRRKKARFRLFFFSLKKRTAKTAPQRRALGTPARKTKAKADSGGAPKGGTSPHQPHLGERVLDGLRSLRRVPRRCVNFFRELSCCRSNENTAPPSQSRVRPSRSR